MSRPGSPSPSVISGKRPASSRFSEASTDQSDGTVRGSDREEDDWFTTVVNKKRSRRLRKWRSAANNSPSMDIDTQSAAPTTFFDSPASPDSPDTPVARGPVNAAKQAIHTTQPAKISVSAECSRLHINYTSARNTLHGIKITVDSISDFRSLNSLLIKSNFPFHTYALEEERKIKAVLRNNPLEIPTDCIKSDLENQNYPVFAVHRMHRRDGTEIGLVLAVLHKSDTAKDIFKSPPRVCGLSGIIVEAPYRKSGPGQCFRCQLYGHAAQIVTQSPAVSNVANLTRQKNANAIKILVTSQNALTAIARLPANPPPRSLVTKFPPWPGKAREQPVTSHAVLRPHLVINAWFRTPARAVSEPVKEAIRDPTKPASAKQESSAGPLGEDILTIMSMLRVVKSPEFAQLAADFRKARSGEDRLMETFLKPNKPRACKLANYIQVRNDRLSAPKGGTYCRVLQKKTLLLSRRYPPLINIEASACRLAMTGHGTLIIVSVYLPPHKPLLRSDIETLLALGDAVILFGDLNSKNTDWRSNTTNASGRMLATLAEDHELAIIAPLTPTYLPANVRHRPNILDLAVLKGVVLSLSLIETVHCLDSDHLPVLLKLGSSTDRRGLPADVRELIRVKNAALRRASAYPTPEYRSRARALQREGKARVREVKNDNWSDLMEEITPTHKAYWAVAKALKSDVCVAMPALKTG
ncbi:RNA-directed DNA polymerase from mobile element jockey [Eumeta japonica]|uniref:RNA-directed DNA polymerase from mobile element jockey n=1 Tax=Eumeta variegata TaxID=151549 RepID=A0A4C1Z6S0_EUMVA|nr:RNA-directed DNA polymerase from mobile element jockey [Eumeta japonica]